jgi:CheY-like chemotaxis protein
MRESRTESSHGMRVAELESAVRHLEAELAAERKARTAAEEANRRKDQFLAILSHEMRSPLNAVLTWVQVLRSGRADAATTAQALASLERSARLQTRMIEDLLDTSRIISGKLSLEIQDADVVAIVRNAVDVAQSAALEKQIALECTVDAKCLPTRADPVRLQQVVGNLLSNSVKFTPPGGSIAIALRCPADSVEIEVRDNGSGISHALLPHIFDPFRQGDASITRRHGGLGLGLAIARHLVELHGGTIEAESDGEGRGAVFRVRMRLESREGKDARPPVGKRAASIQPVLQGIRVLIVDDDRETCLALTTVLREAGSKVRSARSARDALRFFERAPFSVVLTDLAMPESDGYQFISALRGVEGGDRVPVIALTGSAGQEERVRVREAGFVLHLTKPVDTAEVVAAVAMAASGRADEFARRRDVD